MKRRDFLQSSAALPVVGTLGVEADDYCDQDEETLRELGRTDDSNPHQVMYGRIFHLLGNGTELTVEQITDERFSYAIRHDPTMTRKDFIEWTQRDLREMEMFGLAERDGPLWRLTDKGESAG